MAYQQIAGQGVWFADLLSVVGTIGSGSFNTGLVIAATGQKAAMLGRVWFKDGTGTKAIRRVQFRFGGVTKAGGSALTLSLQDVSTASGPPGQPDETQDQTVAIANADASFAANTWYRTGTLSADRTVTYGDELAVVWEFDGGGRLGSDTVTFSTNSTSSSRQGLSPVTLKTGGTWANVSGLVNVILEFSDGTFGTFTAGAPTSNLSSVSYNNGSSPAIYAMPVKLPFNCKVDSLAAYCSLNASNIDFELRLYQGTTVLQTCGSVDATQQRGASFTQGFYGGEIPETALTANTQYYIAVVPTTVNSIQVSYFDVNDANHFTCWPGGIELNHATLSAGVWTKTTTRRLMCDFRLSSFDDGAGGTPGLTVNSSMEGGF